MVASKISFMSVLNWSDQECLTFLEFQRWPDGIACPHCGTLDPYRIERKKPSKNGVRFLWKCRGCKKQFTATVGTIFEGSHIPLNKWFAAIHLMCSSKKGMSAHQIHRQLDVTYKTAWFLMHRIRSAMTENPSPFLAGVVEADETFVGGKYHYSPRAKRMGAHKGRPGPDSNKTAVFGILERGGRVHTEVVPDTKTKTLEPILLQNLDAERTHLMTDEHAAYRRIKDHVPHSVIVHASEYVRGEIHTNGIENYWSRDDPAPATQAVRARGVFAVWALLALPPAGGYGFMHTTVDRMRTYLPCECWRVGPRKLKPASTPFPSPQIWRATLASGVTA